MAQAFLAAAGSGNARYDAGAVTSALMERLMYGVSAPGLERAIVEDISKRDTTDFPTVVRSALGILIGSMDFQRY